MPRSLPRRRGESLTGSGAARPPPPGSPPGRPTRGACPDAKRRSGQGLAARPPDRPRARNRSRPGACDRPGRANRRRGRRAAARARSPPQPLRCRRQARRDRDRPAHEHSQDDRSPADGRVAGACLPADRVGRHDPGQRSRRPGTRVAPGRSRHGHRPDHKGLRAGADATPRRQRPVHRRGSCSLPDRQHRDRGGDAAGTGRAGRPLGRAALARRVRAGARRARRSCPRRQASTGRSRGRHVHDLEPGDVRRRAVRRGDQPTAGGDPRGRGGGGPTRCP